MDRLWEWGRPALVREVVDDLSRDRSIAYTTVMTVMENLHRKGWLRRQRDGRAWRYEPTGSRSGYTASLMSQALATNPDRRTALAHFVLQMSPHDAALLREALEATQPPSARPPSAQPPSAQPPSAPSRPPKAGTDDRRDRPAGLRRLRRHAGFPAAEPGSLDAPGAAAGHRHLPGRGLVGGGRGRAGRAGPGGARHRPGQRAEPADRRLRHPAPRHLRHAGRRPRGRPWPHPGRGGDGPHRGRRGHPPAGSPPGTRGSTRRPSGWSGGPSRRWAPRWSSTRRPPPTAWRARTRP